MADLFRKYKSLYSSTSNSFGTGSSETITPASIVGLPTDTEITLTFDRVDSTGTETPTKMERIIGTIVGSNFVVRTSPASGRGADGTTDQAHTSPVVEMVYNAKDHNDIIDGLVAEHTQAGLHGAITTTSVTSAGDISLADGKNITEATVDPWKTIYIPAGVLKPTTTSGCATVVTVEAGTNDVDYDVLDFDTTSDENAYANVFMPGNWDAGVIQFRYVWTNASGLTTETVAFELSGVSYADSDAIDAAVGTPVEVSDTWLAQGDIHLSAWSADVTIAGTPAAGEFVHFEIMRDVSADDLTGDARLLGIQIRYKETQYNHW